MTVRKKMLCVFAAILAVFGMMLLAARLISPGIHGKIVNYRVNASKKIVYESFKGFFNQNLSFRIPKELTEFSHPVHLMGNDSLDRVNPMNADSVNFLFYIKESNIMLWARFPDAAKDWTEDNCDLILVGFVDQGRIMQYGERINDEKKLEAREIFEKQVLQKMNHLKFTAQYY
jgi:hypothetical protein